MSENDDEGAVGIFEAGAVANETGDRAMKLAEQLFADGTLAV